MLHHENEKQNKRINYNLIIKVLFPQPNSYISIHFFLSISFIHIVFFLFDEYNILFSCLYKIKNTYHVYFRNEKDINDVNKNITLY